MPLLISHTLIFLHWLSSFLLHAWFLFIITLMLFAITPLSMPPCHFRHWYVTSSFSLSIAIIFSFISSVAFITPRHFRHCFHFCSSLSSSSFRLIIYCFFRAPPFSLRYWYFSHIFLFIDFIFLLLLTLFFVFMPLFFSPLIFHYLPLLYHYFHFSSSSFILPFIITCLIFFISICRFAIYYCFHCFLHFHYFRRLVSSRRCHADFHFADFAIAAAIIITPFSFSFAFHFHFITLLPFSDIILIAIIYRCHLLRHFRWRHYCHYAITITPHYCHFIISLLLILSPLRRRHIIYALFLLLLRLDIIDIRHWFHFFHYWLSCRRYSLRREYLFRCWHIAISLHAIFFIRFQYFYFRHYAAIAFTFLRLIIFFITLISIIAAFHYIFTFFFISLFSLPFSFSLFIDFHYYYYFHAIITHYFSIFHYIIAISFRHYFTLFCHFRHFRHFFSPALLFSLFIFTLFIYYFLPLYFVWFAIIFFFFIIVISFSLFIILFHFHISFSPLFSFSSSLHFRHFHAIYAFAIISLFSPYYYISIFSSLIRDDAVVCATLIAIKTRYFRH